MEEETPTQYTMTLYPKHYKYLKTINTNVSDATRKLIEKDINQKKNIILEKYMFLFAIGIMVIVFSLGSVFIAVQLAVGVCFIVYSVVALFLWRLNREMAARAR